MSGYPGGDDPKGDRIYGRLGTNGSTHPPKQLRALDTAELLALPPRDYLLKGVLSPKEISLWVGAPKTGKTFLMMHVAWLISQGRSAFGLRVRPADVLYVAAEGASGLPGRVRALQDLHGPAPGFLAIPQRLDLLNPNGDIDNLIAIAQEHGSRLVVIDTIARTFGSGDENGSMDMGCFCANLDRLKDETGAHVAALHHRTKAGANGPRGHSSLPGMADAIINIARDEAGFCTATVDDAKDDASGMVMAFRLKVVELGLDRDGEPRTTCTVDEMAAPAAPSGPRLGNIARIALDRLHDLVASRGEPLPPGDGFPTADMRGVQAEAWRAAFYDARPGADPSTRRKSFSRACDELVSKRLIGAHDGWAWPAREDGTRGT